MQAQPQDVKDAALGGKARRQPRLAYPRGQEDQQKSKNDHDNDDEGDFDGITNAVCHPLIYRHYYFTRSVARIEGLHRRYRPSLEDRLRL